jgi:hypothetical protein
VEHSTSSTISTPRWRRTRRPGRGDQVLPPVGPVGIVAGPGGLVHQQGPRVTRVRALAVHAGARGGGLQRRVLGALLEEAVPEGVGHGADDHGRERDDHAVDPHVAVGCGERGRLRAVRRLVEGPRALARALRRRVADPHVGEPAGAGPRGRAVRAAPAGAEAVHGHVVRREHHVDGAAGPAAGRELEEVPLAQALAEGAGLVEDVRAGAERRETRPGGGVVLARRLEPRGHGWLLRLLRGGGQGGDEVGYHRALRRGEVAVPDEVDGDGARKERALVVLHRDGRLLDKRGELPRGEAGVEQHRESQQRRSGAGGGRRSHSLREALFRSAAVCQWRFQLILGGDGAVLGGGRARDFIDGRGVC